MSRLYVAETALTKAESLLAESSSQKIAIRVVLGASRQVNRTAVELVQCYLRKLITISDPLSFYRDSIVGIDANDVAIVSGMMQAAQGQAVLNGGDSFDRRIGHDVSALQERSCLQFAHTTPALVHS